MTAQPKSRRDRHKRRARHESGLSLDADELGTPFLSDATEQANFETEGERDLSIGGAPPSDAAFDDTDDPDASLWDRSMQRASYSDVREIIDPLLSDLDDPVDPDDSDDTDPPSVDKPSSRIVDASLFDDDDDDENERVTR